MAREARYTAQISALVEQEVRDRIDALDAAHPEGVGDIIRDALRHGLPRVERDYALKARTREITRGPEAVTMSADEFDEYTRRLEEKAS